MFLFVQVKIRRLSVPLSPVGLWTFSSAISFNFFFFLLWNVSVLKSLPVLFWNAAPLCVSSYLTLCVCVIAFTCFSSNNPVCPSCLVPSASRFPARLVFSHLCLDLFSLYFSPVFRVSSGQISVLVSSLPRLTLLFLLLKSEFCLFSVWFLPRTFRLVVIKYSVFQNLPVCPVFYASVHLPLHKTVSSTICWSKSNILSLPSIYHLHVILLSL